MRRFSTHIEDQINQKIISYLSEQRIYVQTYTFMSNIFKGIGLAYCIEKEKYWHLPFVWFAPSIYVGYQGFQNKDNIKKLIKE